MLNEFRKDAAKGGKTLWAFLKFYPVHIRDTLQSDKGRFSKLKMMHIR